MPIYEFRCSDCGNIFEELVRSADASPGACPSCGGTFLTRQFSAFAVGKAAGKAGAAAEMPVCDSGCPASTGCSTGTCPF